MICTKQLNSVLLEGIITTYSMSLIGADFTILTREWDENGNVVNGTEFPITIKNQVLDNGFDLLDYFRHRCAMGKHIKCVGELIKSNSGETVIKAVYVEFQKAGKK